MSQILTRDNKSNRIITKASQSFRILSRTSNEIIDDFEPPIPSNLLFAETFESPISGWTEIPNFGTINTAYTTEVIAGNKSLFINRVGFDKTYIIKSFTPSSEVWGRFKIKVKTAANNTNFFFLIDSTGANANQLLAMWINNGKLIVHDGSALSSPSVASFNVDTIYYIWFHYKAGSGSNGIVEIWFSENPTRPSNPNYHVIKIDAVKTTNAEGIVVGQNSLSASSTSAIYDEIYLSTEEIL